MNKIGLDGKNLRLNEKKLGGRIIQELSEHLFRQNKKKD